jgi:hypothetical protein
MFCLELGFALGEIEVLSGFNDWNLISGVGSLGLEWLL